MALRGLFQRNSIMFKDKITATVFSFSPPFPGLSSCSVVTAIGPKKDAIPRLFPSFLQSGFFPVSFSPPG